MTDQDILKEAKERIAKKKSFDSWASIPGTSYAYVTSYLQEAALLALQIKGEEMEKELRVARMAFDDMYKTSDKYYKQITDLKAELSKVKERNDKLQKERDNAVELLAADYKVMTREQVAQLWTNVMAKEALSLSQREAKAFDEGVERLWRIFMTNPGMESGDRRYFKDSVVLSKKQNPYKQIEK